MTDARVSRIAVEALVDANAPRRVSRAQVEALIDVNAARRVSRASVEVLIELASPSLTSPPRYLDTTSGSLKSTSLRGYWDVPTLSVKPVSLRGYVEGGVLKSLETKPFPVFYAGTASSTSSGTSFSLALPIGWQPDDVAIAMFQSYALYTAVPAGWTLIASDYPNRGQIVCYKTLVAGDTAVTVGGVFNSIDRCVGTLGVYRGGVVQSFVSGGATGQFNNLPNISTAAPNTMVVTVAGSNGTASDNQVMGGVGVRPLPNSDNRCNVGMADQPVGVVGSTSTVTVNMGGFPRSIVYSHIRLRPA